jgi:ADP-ribosyl-[dinitrogen reductase] hydrolase
MDEVLGCIYGVIVGDALGTTYEFEKAKNIKLPKKLNIIGKGPFKVAKGQVTDDSEMTIALFRSIYKNKKYDKEDVAKAYIRWIKSDPADVGLTTQKALLNAKNYKDTVRNAKKYNQNSLSNGFLMRIMPLAIVGMGLIAPNKDLDKYIKEEVLMTHPDKLCYYTAKLYVKILIYLMLKGELYKDKKENVHNMSNESIEKEALRIIDEDEFINSSALKRLVLSSRKTPHYVNRFVSGSYDIDGEYMGFMFISLQIAFYELYNAKSYEAGMRDIIKYGGDTDTNCAIAGAMLGAKFGYDNIPKRWIKAVEEAKYDRPEEFKVKNLF